MLRLIYRYSRNGVPAQPPMTLGMLLGIQTPQADPQALPFAGEYFEGSKTSQDTLQANRNTTEISFHSIPEPIANNWVGTCLTNIQALQIRSTTPIGTTPPNSGLLAPTPPPNGFNLSLDEGNFGYVLRSTSVQSFSQ